VLNIKQQHYEDNAQALKDPKMVWNMTNGTWYVGLNPPPGSTQLGIWYPRAGNCPSFYHGFF
jgi:choline dehydrogenase